MISSLFTEMLWSSADIPTALAYMSWGIPSLLWLTKWLRQLSSITVLSSVARRIPCPLARAGRCFLWGVVALFCLLIAPFFLLGLFGHLSIPSVLLLSAAALRQYTPQPHVDKNSAPPPSHKTQGRSMFGIDTQPVPIFWCLVWATLGLALYYSTLAAIPLDLYALGYAVHARLWLLLACLAALALALWFRSCQSRLLAISLLLVLGLAWAESFVQTASANLWDLLIDPFLCFYAVIRLLHLLVYSLVGLRPRKVTQAG